MSEGATVLCRPLLNSQQHQGGHDRLILFGPEQLVGSLTMLHHFGVNGGAGYQYCAVWIQRGDGVRRRWPCSGRGDLGIKRGISPIVRPMIKRNAMKCETRDTNS